jgi:PAS domain S-box-containing protein
VWSVFQVLVYPYDGLLTIDPTGLIKEIDETGPTADLLSEGDRILSVDGVRFFEAQPFYSHKRAGQQAVLDVQRGEGVRKVTFQLVNPSSKETLDRLAPLFLALIFWALGLGIQAFKPIDEAGNIYFLFFATSATFLIAGIASTLGPPWTASLLSFLFWLIGPVAVHFHLYFPQKTKLRYQRPILIALYTIALAGGLPYLIFGATTVYSSPYSSQLIFASRIFLVVNFLTVFGLLFYTYRHATTAGVRGKIRIVVLGGFLSLFPLVTLVILPDALFQQAIVPYSLTWVLLSILPLTYGYAIFRHRLIEIERHVNRGATFILVYSTLGGFYLILYTILDNLVITPRMSGAAINTILVLVLATIFVPLHRRVQRIVDSAFYGGWYDYRSAITQITQGLEQVTNLNALAETVSDRLVQTLRLEESCVFLVDLEGSFSIIQVAPRPPVDGGASPMFSPLPRSSLSYLLNMGGAVERTALREALKDVKLSPQELELLNSEQVYLWVPVIGHGKVLGLLALGPKFGGDVFSGEDMDILRVVARQLGPLIENIHLVTRLRRHAADLELRVAERTEELVAAKKRVEAILSSVGEGVVVLDLAGKIANVNAAYEDQSGYYEDELIGLELWKLYRGDDVRKEIEQMQDSLRQQRIWNGELVGQRKYGSEYDVQLTFAPLRDEHNEIIGYVGSQRDITQQKELDRLKDLFVSDVSHELRTPTTNISLYLELMETATPKKQVEYLGVLKEQTRLLMKLVEDILDLSRLAIGKTRRIEFTDVDLNKLAEQVIMAHRPLAEASGLELVFEPDINLSPVWGEPNQLARVINNLVANAIHYTAQGGVYVQTYEDNGDVCLDVRDTGMGINTDDQAHIFERFYRGQQVRQTKIHGTGLGLAIVKEIIDLHESEICVKSEVGNGSTFSIRFPLQVKVPWQEKSY